LEHAEELEDFEEQILERRLGFLEEEGEDVRGLSPQFIVEAS
jgi:hypothetical protein